MQSHERPIEHIRYSLYKEINELYWSVALNNLAVSLVSVFGPLYMFFFFDRSIPKTALFYFVQFFASMLLTPFITRYTVSWGIKKSMALGTMFCALSYECLVVVPVYGFPMIVCAGIMGVLYVTIFWPSRHIDFAAFAKSSTCGRQLSTVNIIISFVKTFAPFIGGLIIYWCGFSILFTIVTILLIISTIPLFYSPEVHEHYSLSWWESFKVMALPCNRKTSLAFAAEGIEYSLETLLWPLFAITIIQSTRALGWLVSFSLFTTVILIYCIGWIADKKGNERVLSFTSVVHAFSWMMMSFVVTPLQLLIYTIFGQLAGAANHLPFMSVWYKRAKAQGHGIDEYIVFHEIAHAIGRCIGYALMAIGFSVGITSFPVYFTIAAFSTLFFRLIR